MRHAQRHAQTRTRERRQRLAIEAARLMAECGIRDFQHAKRKAAERLGIHDDESLPRNSEIEQALREHQRLFSGEAQASLLRTRREAALRAMAFFAAFQPRLVGPVLQGTADRHSAVCLHLYTDDPDAVPRFLLEHRIPAQMQSRRLKLDRDRSAEYPVFVFSAEDTPFDLTVLPLDALRQAPLDRIDDKPMRRANADALRQLLVEEEIAGFESGS